MGPLWLLPIAVLVIAAPFLVRAIRAVGRESEALMAQTALMRGELRPALIRLRHDSDRLARHQVRRIR